MSNGIRLWTLDQKTGKTIHLGGEYTWGDCMEVRGRFEWLSEQKILPFDGDYGDGVVAQVAVITDGVDWIADYVLPLFPKETVHVLDAFHVVQQVTEAARAAFPGKSNERRVRAVAKQALGGGPSIGRSSGSHTSAFRRRLRDNSRDPSVDHTRATSVSPWSWCTTYGRAR